MLKRKFTQIGNSWGIIVPKNILDIVNLNPLIDNEVELCIENNEIKIRKIKKEELWKNY